jgi:hypothetical protein
MTKRESDTPYSFRVNRKEPILEGHTRNRKKLLNPFSSLPYIQTSFTADIFPELLWLALVLDRFGYRAGIEIATPFQVALYKISKKRPWYRLSEIAKLSLKQWERMAEPTSPFKEAILEALTPIAFAYPELGIKFMKSAKQNSDEHIIRLKNSVKRFSNRFETPGAALIGAFVFLQAFVGRIQVPPDVIQGINSIVSNPGSDEAEMASSMVRATMLAMWSADNEDKKQWPKVFWYANLKVSGCDYDRKCE